MNLDVKFSSMPIHPLAQRELGSFSVSVKWPIAKLTADLRQVSKLRVRGVIKPIQRYVFIHIYIYIYIYICMKYVLLNMYFIYIYTSKRT
jgi:hypothetical protein